MKKYLVPIGLGILGGLLLAGGLFWFEFGSVEESFTWYKVNR